MSEHRLSVPILTDAQIAQRMATGHSVYSPSASEMTMTCGESLVLNVLADDVQTYEAAEGTVAHSLGEEWVKSGERPDQWIGFVETVNGFDVEITEEMLSFVEDYYDLCMAVAEDSEEYFAEAYTDISHLTPIPDQGGTCDFLGLRWQKATLIDLKYGKDPVFAYYPDEEKANKQLSVYASGVFREWDWLYNFQEIEIIICQPRLPGGTTVHTISRAELLAFEEEARSAWLRSWRPNSGRTPSIKGCRWCKVRAKCPALYLFMAEDTQDVFDNHDEIANLPVVVKTFTADEMRGANDIILDDMAISPFPKLVPPAELSTAALAKLLRYRKLMETFFNAAASELLTRAISNEEEIPWWKIVESRTLRKTVDDEQWVVEQLLAKGLNKSDLYTRKLASPAQLEKLLHAKLKMKLADAKRWLEDSGLTVKPPGQKTLVATSDNRKALPKDGDVFDSYEDDI